MKKARIKVTTQVRPIGGPLHNKWITLNGVPPASFMHYRYGNLKALSETASPRIDTSIHQYVSVGDCYYHEPLARRKRGA